jgi:heme/copper-type cytochrome/quinol oxidase subunit 2
MKGEVNLKKRIAVLIGILFLVFVAASILGNKKSRVLPPPPPRVQRPPATQNILTVDVVYTPEIPADATPSLPKKTVAPSPTNKTASLIPAIQYFDIKANNTKLDPDEIVVRKGDRVRLEFTATDGDYDLDFPYLGAYFNRIPQGTTRVLPFSTSKAGTYLFKCKNYCPPGRVIQGQLIVLP